MIASLKGYIFTCSNTLAAPENTKYKQVGLRMHMKMSVSISQEKTSLAILALMFDTFLLIKVSVVSKLNMVKTPLNLGVWTSILSRV